MLTQIYIRVYFHVKYQLLLSDFIFFHNQQSEYNVFSIGLCAGSLGV